MRRVIQNLFVVLLLASAAPSLAVTPAIVTGDGTVCLLRQDGSVSCFGDNSIGLATPPLGPFVQISLGTWSGCGLRSDGQIECWGDPNFGLLEVPDGTYLQVDAGDSNHCAVRTDRRIVCWGNLWGDSFIPFQGPEDLFTQVAAGYRNFCGIRLNGTVACNGFFFPDPPSGTFVSVSADTARSDSFCGIRTGGQAVCWGDTPGGAQIAPLGTFTAIGRGAFHACGLRADQAIECWGYFGNQDYRQYFPPDGQFSSLAVGGMYACALRVDGATVCWGFDGTGTAPRLEIEPPVIQAAEVGVPYSVSLSLVDRMRDGSPGPYQAFEPLFATSAGELPPGFAISGDGVLQGTAAEVGEFPITLLAQDANGFEVERELAFTIVNPGQDVTPPEIAAAITGTNLQVGWYTSDITLNWIVNDPQSGATSQVGCSQMVITQDTPRRGSTATCSARSTGGVSSKTVEFRRDATPPALQLSAQSLPEDGFFEVAYSASDATSTVAFFECNLDGAGFTFCQPGVFTIGQLPPGPHTYYVRATDWAGNTTTKSVPLGPIDTTPPVITPSITGPAGGDGWYTGDVTISWTVSDPESNIDISTGCGSTGVTTDTAGITFTCEATSAGGTSQQSVTIKRDTTAPETAILTGPADPIDFGLPASFTFDGTDAGSGIGGFLCSLDDGVATACSTPHQLGVLAPGGHSLNVTATDLAGNADATAATYAWTVSASSDTTPPVVSEMITGTLGTSGWYRSNITVNWTWSDPESAILSVSGCGTSTVTADTSGATFSCQVSSGGGTTQRSATIKRDATPPNTRIGKGKGQLVFSGTDALSGVVGFACSIDGQAFAACTSPYLTPQLPGGPHTLSVRAIDLAGNVDLTPDTYTWTAPPIDVTPPTASPTPSRPANQFGWNSTDVTVTWNWSDSGSGIYPGLCPKSTTSQGEGVQVLSATCMDMQGNKQGASYTVRIDKSKPLLSPFVAIGPVILNATISAVSNARDNISGIANERCDPVVTTAVGKFTIQCVATDLAGNALSAKVAYTVAYRLERYNAPLMDPPMVNHVRQGVIVPVRFRLIDANGAPVAALKGAQYGLLVETTSSPNCTNGTPNPVSETTTNHALRYLGDGNYEGTWSTRLAPGTCMFFSILAPVETRRILVLVTP